MPLSEAEITQIGRELYAKQVRERCAAAETDAADPNRAQREYELNLELFGINHNGHFVGGMGVDGKWVYPAGEDPRELSAVPNRPRWRLPAGKALRAVGPVAGSKRPLESNRFLPKARQAIYGNQKKARLSSAKSEPEIYQRAREAKKSRSALLRKQRKSRTPLAKPTPMLDGFAAGLAALILSAAPVCPSSATPPPSPALIDVEMATAPPPPPPATFPPLLLQQAPVAPLSVAPSAVLVPVPAIMISPPSPPAIEMAPTTPPPPPPAPVVPAAALLPLPLLSGAGSPVRTPAPAATPPPPAPPAAEIAAPVLVSPVRLVLAPAPAKPSPPPPTPAKPVAMGGRVLLQRTKKETAAAWAGWKCLEKYQDAEKSARRQKLWRLTLPRSQRMRMPVACA